MYLDKPSINRLRPLMGPSRFKVILSKPSRFLDNTLYVILMGLRNLL